MVYHPLISSKTYYPRLSAGVACSVLFLANLPNRSRLTGIRRPADGDLRVKSLPRHSNVLCSGSYTCGVRCRPGFFALVPGTVSLWSTLSYFRCYDQIAGPHLAVRIRTVTPLTFWSDCLLASYVLYDLLYDLLMYVSYWALRE